ncbi:MAG: GTP-binding protein [Lachnospiraceae bacterium]
MTKVDLITGFLGAGKTTFIKKYAEYFIRKGEKVSIIENEFGAVAVDAAFLKEQPWDVVSVAGGCMCCGGKSAFQKLLVEKAESHTDRIIVEPSGIYDVDEFFDVMLTEPVNQYCEIGCVLTIADARLEQDLTDEGDYLMYSQLLSAGSIILSKTEGLNQEQISAVIQKLINRVALRTESRAFSAESDFFTKPWSDFSESDYETFSQSGYHLFEHDREVMQHEKLFRVFLLADLCENEEHLRGTLKLIMEDTSCGNIFRIKGHIADTDGNWYEVNCSVNTISTRPVVIKKGIFIVIGQNMEEDKIQSYFLSRRTSKQNA